MNKFDEITHELTQLVATGPVIVVGGFGSGKVEASRAAARMIRDAEPRLVALNLLETLQLPLPEGVILPSDLQKAFNVPVGEVVVFHEIEGIDPNTLLLVWHEMLHFLFRGKNPVFLCVHDEGTLPDVIRALCKVAKVG